MALAQDLIRRLVIFVLVLATVLAMNFTSDRSSGEVPPVDDFYFLSRNALFVRRSSGDITRIYSPPKGKYSLDAVSACSEGFLLFAVDTDSANLTSTAIHVNRRGEILFSADLTCFVTSVSPRPYNPREFALIATHPGNQQHSLMILTDVGTPTQRIEDLGILTTARSIDWSDDGNCIAFGSESGDVYILDYENRKTTKVAAHASCPSWINERTLCFTRRNEVIVKDLQNLSERVLYRDGLAMRHIGLLRGSGRHILWVDSRDFFPAIGVIDVSSGNLRELIKGWSPSVGWVNAE